MPSCLTNKSLIQQISRSSSLKYLITLAPNLTKSIFIALFFAYMVADYVTDFLPY